MENFFLAQREVLGLSQRRIAIALDMTDSAVGSWERGANVPRIALAPKLAAVYQVSQARIEKEIVKLAHEIAAKKEAASAAS